MHWYIKIFMSNEMNQSHILCVSQKQTNKDNMLVSSAWSEKIGFTPETQR